MSWCCHCFLILVTCKHTTNSDSVIQNSTSALTSFLSWKSEDIWRCLIFYCNFLLWHKVSLVRFLWHILFYSPTAEALGSSAIVKVSEQTGAAPKPIPPRFPSKGSQGSLKVPSRFPKGSQKVPSSPSRFLQGSLQGSQVFQVKVVKVPKIIM